MSFTAASFDLTAAQLAMLPHQLIGHADAAFLRNGQGKLGFGQVGRFTTAGEQRFAAIRDYIEAFQVSNRLPAGFDPAAPIGFAALSFDPRSTADSVVLIPRWTVEINETGTRFHVVVPDAAALSTTEAVFDEFLAALPKRTTPAEIPSAAPLQDFTTTDAHMSETAFLDAVQIAVDRLAKGVFDKVVLARDELLHSPTGFDIAATLVALAQQNPTAWTYKVDRLLGATPEMLIAKHHRRARARVLAGTVDRTVAVTPELVAQHLTDNPKQRFEHRAAVDSLVETLSPFSTSLDVGTEPFVLQLPNVYHLATDVAAELTEATSVLDLVAKINPTAAVGGTPRDVAVDTIWELEAQAQGMDRGLYAGAVGWLDATGQGEFGIALRGSIIEDPQRIRIYAGGGIVTGSDPAEELAETHAKMRPMKRALRTLPAT